MLAEHPFFGSHVLHSVTDCTRHWFVFILRTIDLTLDKSLQTTMPWCSAYGWDNSTHKSLPGVSFHCLLLNNTPLLKQV